MRFLSRPIGARLSVAVAAGLLAVAANAQTTPKKPVTPQDLRPPADVLTDCAKAPTEAIVKLPPALASWATVYCTKLGHIFNANEQHFAVFPESGLRASFNASQIDDKPADSKDVSYFKELRYGEMTPAQIAELAKVDPVALKIIGARKPWRLALTTNGGKTLSLVVLDPGVADPFWVFPITDKGLGQPAFFVTSLEMLNRTR